MAIAYLSGGKNFSAANVSSLATSSFTVSGSDRYLIVGVLSGAGTPQNLTSVVWAGQSATQIGTYTTVDGVVRVSMWGLANPTAQSGTVTATWPSAQDETAIVAAAFTGVSGLRASSQATATSTTPSVTVTASQNLDEVVDITGGLHSGGSGPTIAQGAGQTSRQEVEGTNLNYEVLGLSTESATGASTVMSWTSSLAIDWISVGVPMIPASGAVDTPITVTEAALTLAGQDVTLTATGSVTLPVTNAALLLEGQETPFQLSVPWDEATLTFTGQSITLTAGIAFTLAVTEGTLAFTGQSVTLFLDEDFTLGVTEAALTLTGQDVTLNAAASVTLTVDSATLTLTAQDIALTTPFVTGAGGGRRTRKRAIRRLINFGR